MTPVSAYRWSLVLVVLTGISLARAQGTSGGLLEAGLHAEYMRGELQEAIHYYRQVISRFPDDRHVAAQALLRVAVCREKLGSADAVDTYAMVLQRYPDQTAAADEARRHWDRLMNGSDQASAAGYYFDRIGVDLLTATSYDGRWIAQTDWNTGSLVVRDRRSGRSRTVVPGGWPRTRGFAFRPIWSRDNRRIAYTWYRNHRGSELRIVGFYDPKAEWHYHDSSRMITPEDWSPDGSRLLCQMRDPLGLDSIRLALLDLNDRSIRELLTLTPHARSFRFSHDGRYLAYDGLVGSDRQAFVLDIENGSQIQISPGQYGWLGSDGPIWSADGRHILYRSARLGKLGLWSIPVLDGQPAGKATLVCRDLPDELLKVHRIVHGLPLNTPSAATTLHREASSAPPAGFNEEFSGTRLDSAWSVFVWDQPNVYGYKTLGRFSLTRSPGSLRYLLDPITVRGYSHAYQPHYSGWYWVYPALELSRPLWGRHWVLDTKITYSMVDGVNGRAFLLVISFGTQGDRESALVIRRGKDIVPPHGSLAISLVDFGATVISNDQCLSPGDSSGVDDFTYFYRILRSGSHLSVDISEDGTDYRQALTAILPAAWLEQPQMLSFSSESWFLPAGSYADWDYVRFRVLPH